MFFVSWMHMIIPVSSRSHFVEKIDWVFFHFCTQFLILSLLDFKCSLKNFLICLWKIWREHMVIPIWIKTFWLKLFIVNAEWQSLIKSFWDLMSSTFCKIQSIFDWHIAFTFFWDDIISLTKSYLFIFLWTFHFNWWSRYCWKVWVLKFLRSHWSS
jgi:hypothetical protein